MFKLIYPWNLYFNENGKVANISLKKEKEEHN